MIYTILVALDADPLLPRCRFTGLADPGCYLDGKRASICEGIIYLSEAERIHSTHFTHLIHAGEPITYKGAEKGDVTESRK